MNDKETVDTSSSTSPRCRWEGSKGRGEHSVLASLASRREKGGEAAS